MEFTHVNANQALVKPEETKKLEDKTEADVTSCGLSGCRSAGLQKLATIGMFTGALSLPVLLTSTLSSYVNSQVTTLEKQFGLSSSQTGLLMAANDIGYVVVAAFVSYFAPRAHVPRVLSVCAFVFGLSGIVCALPHFLFGVESVVEGDTHNVTSQGKTFFGQLCPMNDSDRCSVNEQGVPGNKPKSYGNAALAIIAFGMFLQGVAKAPRHPFTVTYLDDNVVRTKTGFFLGILITCGIMGPVLAYSLGGYFTRIYVTLEETSLTPRHPKWVGAWWMGYLVFGVSALVVSLPLFFFPRKLRGAPVTHIDKHKQKINSPLKEAKNYVRLMLKIVTNSIYMCLLVSTITVIFSVGALHSFLPKYLETQFGLEAWKANIILAGMSLSTACVGTFIGGYMSKRLKMGALLALKWNCSLYCIVVLFFCFGFFFGCGQPNIRNMPGSATTDECMSECGCESDGFFPICGSDNANYFSPCHAGCSTHDSGMYTNCTCIPGGSANAGSCQYDCPYMVPYLVSIGIAFFASTLSIIPKITSEIRCVGEEEKALSVGVQTVMASLLGWMISPIISGRVIDTSCLIWDSDCNKRGACVLYDMADFRLKLHGLVVGGRVVSFLFTLIALTIALVTKRLHPKPVEEGKEEKAMMIGD